MYFRKNVGDGSPVLCGEWLRLAVSGISPEETVEALNMLTGWMVDELKRNDPLRRELDVAIDFHNIRRHDRKSGPEIVRGGDKKTGT